MWGWWMDVIPQQLEIDDVNGRVLIRRPYPDLTPRGLKVIEDIDMSGNPPARYILKVTTDSGVILRQISIG